MGKQVSAVTGSMKAYSTRPNVRVGSSSSLMKWYNLNRAVLVSNTANGNNYSTTTKSTALMKNGFINKFGNNVNIYKYSMKVIPFN